MTRVNPSAAASPIEDAGIATAVKPGLLANTRRAWRTSRCNDSNRISSPPCLDAVPSHKTPLFRGVSLGSGDFRTVLAVSLLARGDQKPLKRF